MNQPNAPKSQPCPNCHTSAKRTDKRVGLAVYQCSRCHLRFSAQLRRAAVKGPIRGLNVRTSRSRHRRERWRVNAREMSERWAG